ncbi:MAG: GtrA family protein [Gammaproteobacteria bacterium]|nr:GtrA family protein [Gammaproteobacteria bacterium]
MSWQKRLLQSARFVLSGGIATASHWLVMAFMVNVGIRPLIATATGAFIGAIINYILQRYVTFQTKAVHRTVLLRYTGVCIIIWFSNFFIFISLFHIARLTPIYAQGITTLTLAVMSYYFYKRMVFNDQRSQPVY